MYMYTYVHVCVYTHTHKCLTGAYFLSNLEQIKLEQAIES